MADTYDDNIALSRVIFVIHRAAICCKMCDFEMAEHVESDFEFFSI